MKYILLNGHACPVSKEACVSIKKVDFNYAKRWLIGHKAEIINAIGHVATAEFIESLFGVKLPPARRLMLYFDEDAPVEVLAIVLMERVEEGRILNKEELTKLSSDGKVEFRMMKVEKDEEDKA